MPLYYSKAQTLALLDAKLDLVGNEDMEFTDATKGPVLRETSGDRVRIILGQEAGLWKLVTEEVV